MRPVPARRRQVAAFAGLLMDLDATGDAEWTRRAFEDFLDAIGA